MITDKKEQGITRTYLKDILAENVLTVEFVKKDGTLRKMKCTLNPELIPPKIIKEDAKEPPKKKTVNENVLAVYDLEAKSWRSFTISKLKAFSFFI